MNKKLMAFILVMALSILSCETISGNNTNSENTRADPYPELANAVYGGMDEWALETYEARLTVEFQGSTRWIYSLTTRSDGTQLEYYLKIEGTDTVQDLGDILLVTDGTTSWMTGEGADNQCFMFPNKLDMGMSFLTPDDLISPVAFSTRLVEAGIERIAGRQTTQYTFEAGRLEGWEDVKLALWLADQTTVMQYVISARGEDPLFDAGIGELKASYSVANTDPQTLQVVSGCQINYPLPSGVFNIVRIPGIVSFESTMSVEDMTDYMLEAMYAQGWQIDEDPLLFEDGNVQMRWYTPLGEVIVMVKPTPGGSLVEIVER